MSSISIENKPDKLIYEVGENEIDLAGGVIKVHYSNDDVELVNMTDSKVTHSGFNTSTASESVTIVIKYENKEASFSIKVNEPEPVLESISIKGITKNVYFIGETELDLSGGIRNS